MDTITIKRTGIRADDEAEAMTKFKRFLSKELEVVRFTKVIQNSDGSFYWQVTAEVKWDVRM